MYVYIRSEENLWTVGFYDPTGKWHSDHGDREEAADPNAIVKAEPMNLDDLRRTAKLLAKYRHTGRR